MGRWPGLWLRLHGLVERERPFTELRAQQLQQTSEAAAQEERNRLARDLHDSIKQQLFSIHVGTAAVQARWENDPDGAKTALADVRHSAQAALVEMNALLGQLSPEPLAKVGLVEALRAAMRSPRLPHRRRRANRHRPAARRRTLPRRRAGSHLPHRPGSVEQHRPPRPRPNCAPAPDARR